MLPRIQTVSVSSVIELLCFTLNISFIQVEHHFFWKSTTWISFLEAITSHFSWYPQKQIYLQKRSSRLFLDARISLTQGFPWCNQESVESIGNGSQHRANGKKVHSATKVREKSLSVNLCNVASDQICLCHFSHQYNMEYPEGEATF